MCSGTVRRLGMTTHTVSNTVISTQANQSAIVRHLPSAARFVLGAAFFVFGLNGFLNFMPPPPSDSMPEGAVALGMAFMKSG
jgi:hypothetical protein